MQIPLEITPTAVSLSRCGNCLKISWHDHERLSLCLSPHALHNCFQPSPVVKLPLFSLFLTSLPSLYNLLWLRRNCYSVNSRHQRYNQRRLQQPARILWDTNLNVATLFTGFKSFLTRFCVLTPFWRSVLTFTMYCVLTPPRRAVLTPSL